MLQLFVCFKWRRYYLTYKAIRAAKKRRNIGRAAKIANPVAHLMLMEAIMKVLRLDFGRFVDW